MIPVYVGSAEKFACCETAIINSIEENTQADIDVQIIRPNAIGMGETGCTGFTNVRYAVPELLRKEGKPFGIYLDVDMIVLGDIAELYSYKHPGAYTCIKDGSTEVAVISASLEYPSIEKLTTINKHELDRMTPKRCSIPLEWNCEDCYPSDAKLLHFTDLKKQPWFHDGHPCPEACKKWEYYAHKT